MRTTMLIPTTSSTAAIIVIDKKFWGPQKAGQTTETAAFRWAKSYERGRLLYMVSDL